MPWKKDDIKKVSRSAVDWQDTESEKISGNH